MSLFDSTLTDFERSVPEGHYEEEQMKQTVVPNRNAIFSSILYGYALSVSAKENVDVSVTLGVHSGDHAIYPDCRPEFYDMLMRAFETGNWGSERVTVNLPYVDGDKESILRDAIISCDSLGLDFDTVFSNTNTSYSPDELGRSSGKTGADVERILAFHAIGRKDPVQYVENWDTVLEHAIETERQFEAVL
jgi:7-cyano-7-deazaguanine synthase